MGNLLYRLSSYFVSFITYVVVLLKVTPVYSMSDVSLSRYSALLNCDTASTEVADWQTKGHPGVIVIRISVSVICTHYFNSVANM